MDYFKNKNDNIFHLVENEGGESKDMITLFAKILDDADSKYDLKIITDNPSYDVVYIDFYFAKYLNRHPMAYRFDGVYRDIYCTDTFASGLGIKCHKSIGLVTNDQDIASLYHFKVEPHDSNKPQDHAEYIYKFCLECIKKRPEKKKIMICIIDVEAFGANIIKNGIAIIGYCVGDLHGKILKKERFYFKLDVNCEIEPRCMIQFWNNNKTILDTVLENGLDPLLQISKFATAIDDLDAEYDLKIVNDNVTLDLAYINYYYAKYLNRFPITYRQYDGLYRNIYSVDDFSRGILNANFNELIRDKNIIEKYNIDLKNLKKTHLPDKDAEYIYKFHIELLKKIRNL